MADKLNSYFLFTILLTLPTHTTGSVSSQNNVENPGLGLSDSHVSKTSHHSLPITSSMSTIIPSGEVFMENECSTWNKANVTADDYHESYCSSRCSGDTELTVPSYEDCPGNNLRCFPCSCQRPQCEVYGTCCPSIHRQETSTEANDFQPEDIIIMCDDYSTPSVHFLYIRSCPKHFSDNHVVSMCLDDVPAHEQTTVSFSRAHDNTTGVVFYNKYCADCNDVSTSILWEVNIACMHYQHVYSATTKDELLRFSLKVGSTCKVHQTSPEYLTLHPCEIEWFGEVISSCDVGGELSVTDHDVFIQCEMNPDLQNVTARIFNQVRGTYYRNIFCAMCNSNSSSVIKCRHVWECPSLFTNHPQHVLPFSLLLGSILEHPSLESTHAALKYQKCSISEWPSPDNKCLNLQCSKGKILNNGTCGTAINIITGLAYKLHVVYTRKSILGSERQPKCPSHHSINSSHLVNHFAAHFENLFRINHIVENAHLQISYIQNNNNRSITNKCPSAVVSGEMLHNDKQNVPQSTAVERADFLLQVRASFVANTFIPRDKFENEFMTLLKSNVAEMEGEYHSTLSPPMFVPDVPDSVTCFNQLITHQDQRNYETVITFRNIAGSTNISSSYRNNFLTLSPVLTCAHITFNHSEFHANINCTIFPPTWEISLILGQVTLSFSAVPDLNRLAVTGDNEDRDIQLKICVDLLEEKVQELNNRPRILIFEESEVYLWQYYLSQVCIGLSMICLLVTLLTFLVLPTLRNNAGTNNMFLSGTILLAQASLLSSVHVDGPSSLCTVLGICTHFLWLSVTCWSFICCLHMFRVFTAKTGVTQSSAASRQISLIKRVVSSILAPAVVIATVMASSYLISGGQRIGYTDSNPCYLDSRLVILLSLVAPLGIVCVVNVYFFTSTIYKIHQVTMLQSDSRIKKKERETFTIYIKLSTMTGSFWTVAIVSELVNNEPLRFIAIILNGSQGVFLFLSLICNKRVMRACFRALFSQQRCSETSDCSRTELSQEKTTNMSSPS